MFPRIVDQIGHSMELPESGFLQRWTTAGLRIICDDLRPLYAQACSHGSMFVRIPQLAVDEFLLPFIFTQYMMQNQKPGVIQYSRNLSTNHMGLGCQKIQENSRSRMHECPALLIFGFCEGAQTFICLEWMCSQSGQPARGHNQSHPFFLLAT